MKSISTYAHGAFEYILGVLLLLAPNLFGFARMAGPPTTVARVVGLLVILQALFTHYELGLFKALPMRAHMVGDYILWVFLAISPWLFRFNHQGANVWLTYVLIGIAGYIVTALTYREPRRIEAGT